MALFIRCIQGHSADAALDYRISYPMTIQHEPLVAGLYHTTYMQFVPQILQFGLLSREEGEEDRLLHVSPFPPDDVRNESGEVVFTKREPIGTATAVDVRENKSQLMLDGEARVAEGDLVILP